MSTSAKAFYLTRQEYHTFRLFSSVFRKITLTSHPSNVHLIKNRVHEISNPLKNEKEKIAVFSLALVVFGLCLVKKSLLGNVPMPLLYIINYCVSSESRKCKFVTQNTTFRVPLCHCWVMREDVTRVSEPQNAPNGK